MIFIAKLVKKIILKQIIIFLIDQGNFFVKYDNPTLSADEDEIFMMRIFLQDDIVENN